MMPIRREIALKKTEHITDVCIFAIDLAKLNVKFAPQHKKGKFCASGRHQSLR